MKALLIVAVVMLGLLLVPPLLFFAVYDRSMDTGHPPAIILPYIYLLLGFSFLAPVGAVLALTSAQLAFERGTMHRIRYFALILGLFFCVTSLYAWLHEFH